MSDPPWSPVSSWHHGSEASGHRLVLLVGPRVAETALEKLRPGAPGCIPINLSLALSRRLLDFPSRQRPALAPTILADLLSGQEPALLHYIELLFEPTLQLDPLRALKAASRSRTLLVLWPGTFEGGNLTYAEPGYPEYRHYGPTDLAETLIIPAAELATEA
ncbi:MAG: BREX-3 system P-loop-containing protein BrxF [Anaerolineae bacterium]|nr:BREX-3 system P-loop-containing protein BrxF [Anaerolineae bacterium]